MNVAIADVNLDTRLGPGNYYRLAKLTGLSRRHVSRVLKGQTQPSFNTLTLLADAAEVTLDELRSYIDKETDNGNVTGNN